MLTKNEINLLKTKYTSLEARVEWPEKSTATHSNLVHTNEHFLCKYICSCCGAFSVGKVR